MNGIAALFFGTFRVKVDREAIVAVEVTLVPPLGCYWGDIGVNLTSLSLFLSFLSPLSSPIYFLLLPVTTEPFDLWTTIVTIQSTLKSYKRSVNALLTLFKRVLWLVCGIN